jgi:Uma2 family endonuclease
MGTYAVATPGVECADNATVRLDLDNEPQPDLLLRVAEACGGSSRLDAEGYLAGAPELVAEVAASSASYDLHDKLHVYRRSGVREYLVWRVDDHEVDWFVLRGSSYQVLRRESGLVRSEAFPGLWLAVPALLGGDGSGLLRVLDDGLASPEHAALVARLAGSRR